MFSGLFGRKKKLIRAERETVRRGPDGIEVRVIRSSRKTMSVQVKPEGTIVRAPLTISDAKIERFLTEHSAWIRKQRDRIAKWETEASFEQKLSAEEVEALKRKASAVFRERVEHFARIAEVSYGRITIRAQRTRWGSCSSKGNLNFNCLLLLAPPEVLDSVVVHELCHRKEMNHTPRFYEEVYRLFPGYRECDRWLKENGRALLSRIEP